MSSSATVNRVTILALGLIGGSLARAIKHSGFARSVNAWGHREGSLQRGQALGIIDSYSTDLGEAVSDSDIVVICTPTRIAETMLARLQPLLSEKTIITDAASVKGNLLRAAQAVYGRVPARLVLGHPIAGSEQSGVEAARADLYEHHRVILTPTTETDPAALDTVSAMWRSAGAEVVTMSVADHDKILAATSHLPHVLAYSLVDTLAHAENEKVSQDIFRFAAGGFRDFTRIASSDPTMWQEICLANRDALLQVIDSFSDGLAQLRRSIEADDGEAIIETFTRAKAARDHFAELLRRQQDDPGADPAADK